MFCLIHYKDGYLAASDVFRCLHNQVLNIPLSYTKKYRCLKKVIHQIDSKNEGLLLYASFAAKFEFIFVLTLENAFFRGFILKPTERALVLLKTGTRNFQNSPPFERSACFYVTISGNFEHFQHSNFETNFQKTGERFFC